MMRTRRAIEKRNSGTVENEILEVAPSFNQTAVILGVVKALEDDLSAKVDATRKDLLEAFKSETVERDRLLQQLKTEIQALGAEVKQSEQLLMPELMPKNTCISLFAFQFPMRLALAESLP
jgi:hypothetical protein